MPRVIFFDTTSVHKLDEAKKHFDRYGLTVVNTKPIEEPFATIYEHTKLTGKYAPYTGHQLEVVVHTSVLVYIVNGPDRTLGSLTHTVEGYMDLTKKHDHGFGFDSYFVVANLNKTYYELQQLGFKVSARDHCLSKFIEQFLYRTKLGDWKFNPQNYDESLELHRDPYGFFQNNPHIQNAIAAQYGIPNMVRYVCNKALFFRASKNRRQNLYWYPGLNAGIPFVTKPKDPMHELIFFVHDMTHHAMPDLLYTGEGGKYDRFVYIVYRLMSEAITLVCADMFFADSLLKAGYKYNTIEERKIYPMFQSMNVRFDSMEVLFDILRASMRFCLFGDASGFQKFNPDQEKLKEFVGKYEKFFIQDFKWTIHNYDNMNVRKNTYARWWQMVSKWSPEFNESRGEPMVTIGDFIKKVDHLDELLDKKDYDQACHSIFEKILEMYIRPAFMNDNKLDPFEIRYDRTFRRYMIGQCYIFFQYPATEGSDNFLNNIDALMKSPAIVDHKQGMAVRGFYAKHLENLQGMSLITSDDLATFKEVYPLFEPMILSYDDELTEDHRAFVHRIS